MSTAPDRFARVFGDWTPRAEVVLEARPDAVTIRICDNGVGLPEDRARLFEPYVTLKQGGTGLGLAIVKHIVERHRGKLDIASRQGTGTTVTVRLPLATMARDDTGETAGETVSSS